MMLRQRDNVIGQIHTRAAYDSYGDGAAAADVVLRLTHDAGRIDQDIFTMKTSFDAP